MKALLSLRPWLGVLAERRGRLLLGAVQVLLSRNRIRASFRGGWGG